MESDPEPEPQTKGEHRRKQILQAIVHFSRTQSTDPSIQDVRELTGIRSFDTLTRHLKMLKQDGLIELDNSSHIIKVKAEAGKMQ
jgi:SOS-response transcriptional repressor LexA